jgi:hypothetical protein
MASRIGAEAKLLQLPDLEEGRILVGTLPLCQAGLIQTELIALHPMQY